MDTARGFLVLICSGILQLSIGGAVELVAKDLMVTNAERTIDIASQLVKINTKLTLSNEGQSTLKIFHFTIEGPAFDKVSYIGASVSNKDSRIIYRIFGSILTIEGFFLLHRQVIPYKFTYDFILEWTPW